MHTQLRVAHVAAVIAVAVAAVASAAAHPNRTPTDALALPHPTGPAPVGTTVLHLVDLSRVDRSMPSGHRELMVQLWYPAASKRAGTLARYMPAKVAALVEHEDHVPPGTISRLRVHATVDAQAASGRHPVVIFSPGSSEMRSVDSALVEDLASSGFIVAELDHTHESELVGFPDGKIVHGSFFDTGTASNERALRTRLADVHFLLQQLPSINRRGTLAGRLDPSETGIFGFSLGGATAAAAAAMLANPTLKAGADLDGSIYGTVKHRGLSRPFLFMLEARGRHIDPSVKTLAAHLRGPHLLLGLRGSAHESFTDFVWIKPQLAQITPAAAKQLAVGTVGPGAVRDESAYLTAFFDRYLRHTPEPLLQHPSAQHPDVLFLRR